MNKRKNNYLSAVLLLSSFLSAPAVFAEGGGVGNGGIFIQCAGESPEILESHLLKKAGTPTLLNLKAAELKKIILKRLAQLDPAFSALVEDKIETNGSFLRWSRSLLSTAGSFDETLESPLSKDCKLIQGAIFYGDSIPQLVRLIPSELAEAQGVLLEFHEAIFAIGVNQYEHLNPVATRELLMSLLTTHFDRGLAETNLQRFKNFPQFLKRVKLGLEDEFLLTYGYSRAMGTGFAADRDEAVNDVYLRSKLFQSSFRAKFCPSALIAEPTGGWGTQLEIYYLNHLSDSGNAPKSMRSFRVRSEGTHSLRKLRDKESTTFFVQEGDLKNPTSLYSIRLPNQKHFELGFNAYESTSSDAEWLKHSFKKFKPEVGYTKAVDACLYSEYHEFNAVESNLRGLRSLFSKISLR